MARAETGVLTATVDQLQSEVDTLRLEVACLGFGLIAMVALVVAIEFKLVKVTR